MSALPTPSQLLDTLQVVERAMSPIDARKDALTTLTGLAVELVPGAELAGITRGRHDGGFRSLAATSDTVRTIDEIQHELRTGPCVDAVVEAQVFVTGDLSTDGRWPDFGRRAFSATGVRSVLSSRLFLEDEPTAAAALNLYSTEIDAFDQTSESYALALATAGALAVSTAIARERANNLLIALESRTEIGIAIGVLMNRHKATREEGFDLLRLASQSLQRKLADVAHEVAETGTLPDLPTPRG